jgi:hypothetical protein
MRQRRTAAFALCCRGWARRGRVAGELGLWLGVNGDHTWGMGVLVFCICCYRVTVGTVLYHV